MIANIEKKNSRKRNVFPNCGIDFKITPTRSRILLTLFIVLNGLKTLKTLSALSEGKKSES